MPAPDTEKPPSSWEVTNDYSKTVITLASGFLAVTVTFATHLVSKETPAYEKWLLVGTWVCLIFTIAFSVVTVMLLINYLQAGNNAGAAIFCANTSFILLALAGGCFLVFGASAFVFNTKAWDGPTVVEKTLAKMPTLSGIPDSKWTVNTLRWDEATKTYRLEVVDDKSGAKFSISVDTTKNNYTEVERRPKEIQPTQTSVPSTGTPTQPQAK